MKFLVDENMARAIVVWLRPKVESGYSVADNHLKEFPDGRNCK